MIWAILHGFGFVAGILVKGVCFWMSFEGEVSGFGTFKLRCTICTGLHYRSHLGTATVGYDPFEIPETLV